MSESEVSPLFLAAREAAVIVREQKVAEREADLDTREDALILREAAVAAPPKVPDPPTTIEAIIDEKTADAAVNEVVPEEGADDSVFKTEAAALAEEAKGEDGAGIEGHVTTKVRAPVAEQNKAVDLNFSIEPTPLPYSIEEEVTTHMTGIPSPAFGSAESQILAPIEQVPAAVEDASSEEIKVDETPAPVEAQIVAVPIEEAPVMAEGIIFEGTQAAIEAPIEETYASTTEELVSVVVLEPTADKKLHERPAPVAETSDPTLDDPEPEETPSSALEDSKLEETIASVVEESQPEEVAASIEEMPAAVASEKAPEPYEATIETTTTCQGEPKPEDRSAPAEGDLKPEHPAIPAFPESNPEETLAPVTGEAQSDIPIVTGDSIIAHVDETPSQPTGESSLEATTASSDESIPEPTIEAPAPIENLTATQLEGTPASITSVEATPENGDPAFTQVSNPVVEDSNPEILYAPQPIAV